jgi:hypothetical protein
MQQHGKKYASQSSLDWASFHMKVVQRQIELIRTSAL